MRLAQLDRAFGYGPKGRGFESSNARLFFDEKALFYGLSFLMPYHFFNIGVDILNILCIINIYSIYT